MNLFTRVFKEIFNSKSIHAEHAKLMEQEGYVYTKADVMVEDQWGNVGGITTFREGCVLPGVKNWFRLSSINESGAVPHSAIAGTGLRYDLYEKAVHRVLAAQ